LEPESIVLPGNQTHPGSKVRGFAEVSAHAQDHALEKFVGRWDVQVKTLQPQKSDLTYIVTSEWMLDRKFIGIRAAHGRS